MRALLHILSAETFPGLIAVLLMTAAMLPIAAVLMSAYSFVRYRRSVSSVAAGLSKPDGSPEQPPPLSPSPRHDFDVRAERKTIIAA